jgi:hypothetical protein
MCCKLLRVEELDLPPLTWCPNCDVKSGCSIYAERPHECRQFYCEYLLDPALSERWKPSRCKMVVVREDHGGALLIHVDPDRANAWREEPYASDIRAWCRAAARLGRDVIVWQGDTKIVLTETRQAAPAASTLMA